MPEGDLVGGATVELGEADEHSRPVGVAPVSEVVLEHAVVGINEQHVAAVALQRAPGDHRRRVQHDPDLDVLQAGAGDLGDADGLLARAARPVPAGGGQCWTQDDQEEGESRVYVSHDTTPSHLTDA